MNRLQKEKAATLAALVVALAFLGWCGWFAYDEHKMHRAVYEHILRQGTP